MQFTGSESGDVRVDNIISTVLQLNQTQLL